MKEQKKDDFKNAKNEKINKDDLLKINAYWRASNYLSIAQQYLIDNPLLKEKLEAKHIKNRIIAPWGTVPGQNFVYTHLNRVIKKYDLDMILLSGPGHGGHFWTSNTYLEGSLTEFYPMFSQDKNGIKNFCKSFCFPGGMSSHVAADMPGSINEGGELGYSIAHGCGAIFDNPDLIATVIVGDGEAETGPLATSWHTNKFINPLTDGAVLPILHLNGFKVANPTVLARISNEELRQYFSGCGWKPYFVEGSSPLKMHELMCDTLDKAIEEIKSLQKKARENNDSTRPVWPMIILRTPKGWTCPKEIDGVRIEGTHNAYHVPIPMTKPNHINLLEEWLKSYKPEELFNDEYELIPELKKLTPTGESRIGSNPHTNGGLLLKELNLPNYKNYAVKLSGHGTENAQDTLVLSNYIRDLINKNPHNFRLFGPDEMPSNRIYAIYETTNNVFNAEIYEEDDYVAKSGRIMDAYLSEHMCEGWLEGYLLTGRHGTFITYEAFARVVDSMISQHIKWLKACREISWRKDVSSLNLVLTSHTWQQEHNGYSHQDPGLLNHLANKKEGITELYLPPDANCLLYVYDKCLRSKNKVNAIVASKHSSPQWLSIEEATLHCEKGISIWDWAGSENKSNDSEEKNKNENPDVVLACSGDVITLETLAAASILKNNLPDLKLRFVNVVTLLRLASNTTHSCGLTDEEYDNIFTKDKPIIFNFHGYPDLIHQLIWSRTNRNISVHGYKEEGNVSTPFDIRVQNQVDRFHIVKDILSKIPQTDKVKELNKTMDTMLEKHTIYVRQNGIDMPEILNWDWNDNL
ncbi:MAG: phosphoketolase family protein [Clostridia bacterium]|nr:phosphoketolase family protein [Clostridia bacterium]